MTIDQYIFLPTSACLSDSNFWTKWPLACRLTLTLSICYLKVMVVGQSSQLWEELEPLGQCIPVPRHVLPMSRYGCILGSVIRIAIKIYSDVHWPICQPSLKISCKSVQKFLRKVANKQTNKQRRKHNLLGGGKNAAKVVVQPWVMTFWLFKELKKTYLHYHFTYVKVGHFVSQCSATLIV